AAKAISAPSAPETSEVAKRHSAAVARGVARASIAVQNSSAEMRKARCCAACQPVLASARSNSAGACHSHSAAAWSNVAATGAARERAGAVARATAQAQPAEREEQQRKRERNGDPWVPGPARRVAGAAEIVRAGGRGSGEGERGERQAAPHSHRGTQ